MTIYSNSHQTHQAYVNWLSNLPLSVALTLNFRADIHEVQAISAARHFWRLVDTKVWGANAVKRRNVKLIRVCALEGEANVRNWHYHAAVQLPEHLQAHDFHEMLLNTWGQMREAGKYSACKPIHHRVGWLNYICKDVRTRGEALCLVTSHIPNSE
jgi:hypothetical protein